jgi:ribose-phosphate pyrophosphokinase
VIICRSLQQPNDKLVELLLASRTARELGARTLTLVAPYLCYMRQDKAFRPGEAVSQRIIGRFIAELFDHLITVDPHLHRVQHLRDSFPMQTALALSATELLGDFLLQQKQDFILLGPDEESEQWVEAIAARGRFSFAVASKQRFADRHVEVSLPDLEVEGRDMVLVDDMISTGHTMIESARQLYALGAKSVSCLVTHALFSDAEDRALRQAGIRNIWSSDAIPHPSNVVALQPLLTRAMRPLINEDQHA